MSAEEMYAAMVKFAVANGLRRPRLGERGRVRLGRCSDLLAAPRSLSRGGGAEGMEMNQEASYFRYFVVCTCETKSKTHDPSCPLSDKYMPQPGISSVSWPREGRQAVSALLPIQARVDAARKALAVEPKGMVSHPHVCWATDALSHALRDIEALIARLEASGS